MAKLLATVGLSVILASGATAATTSKAPPTPPKSQEQTYCFQTEPATGSHISTQECHTKAEWKDLGIDVDELLKKH